MREHHIKAVENLKNLFIDDPSVIALIFSGSVARGLERVDSDIDGTLIVTPEKRDEMKALNKMAFNLPMEKDPYEGGYYDLKIMTVSDLEIAALKGNDPNRYYFVGSKVLFSKNDKVQPLIDQITTYTDAIKKERIRISYAGLILSKGYFWDCAINESNRYLLMKSACDIVLFGIRMLYAYNEIFWPCHRTFLYPKYFSQLKEVPENILELANELTETMSTESMNKFCDAIMNFTDWGLDPASGYSDYITYFEKFWIYGHTNAYEM